MKNYYKILNIDSKASQKDIKSAYRKLALQCHPDVNKQQNAAQNFIRIAEAYEILDNSASRLEYDILYRIKYKDLKKAEKQHEYRNSFNNFTEKYKDFGRKRANRYSKIPYRKFAKVILSDLQLSVSYLPNIITILFIMFMIIGLFYVILINFELKKDYPIVLLLLVVSLPFFYITKKMISIAKDDFLEDRKSSNFNK